MTIQENVKITAEFDDKASAGIKKVDDNLKNLDKTAGKTGGSGLVDAIKNIGQQFRSLTSGGQGAVGAIQNVGSAAGEAAQGIAGLSRGAVVAVGAIGGLAAAAIAGFAAIEAIAKQARAAADDNAELADKLGVTTKRLEALKVVAGENSGTVEGLQRVFDKLSKSLNKLDEDNEKTAYSFAVLGLKIEDLAGLSESEVAGKIIKNYDDLGRSTKATAAVQQLLGSSFREQIPAIKAMSEGIEEAEDRVTKYGATASPALVKAGGEQEVALTNLGLAWKGLSNEIAESASKAFTSISQFAADSLNTIRNFLKESRALREDAAATEAIPMARRNELLKQATRESDAAGDGTFGDINKRFKAYLATEKALAGEMDRELDRIKAKADAARQDSLRAVSDQATPPAKKIKEIKSELEGLVDQLTIANKAFGLDDAAKAGLEAKLKFVKDIKAGVDPAVASALLAQAQALITLNAALLKAAEGQKAYDDAKKGIFEYEQETQLIAYEATLIGKTADERQRLIEKFKEEIALRKIIAGLSDTDVKAIAEETRAASAKRDEAKKALEDAKIANEFFDKSLQSAQDNFSKRIQILLALYEQGKITIEDFTRLQQQEYDKLLNVTKKTADESMVFWQEAARGIQQSLQTFFFDFMQGKMDDLGASFKKVIDQMVANALAAKLAQALFGNNFEKTGQLGGFAGTAVGYLGSLFGGARENGGDVQAGRAYVVGEKRPELFIPSQSGTIQPSLDGMSNGGGTMNLNITAMDSQSVIDALDQVARKGSQVFGRATRRYNNAGAR